MALQDMYKASDKQGVGSELAVEDRRRAKRLFLAFSVEVTGTKQDGQPFAERAKTQDISETGCRILTNFPLKRGDIVQLRLLPPSGERLPPMPPRTFEIKWVTREIAGWSAGAHQIGDEKIWKVSFPPVKS